MIYFLCLWNSQPWEHSLQNIKSHLKNCKLCFDWLCEFINYGSLASFMRRGWREPLAQSSDFSNGDCYLVRSLPFWSGEQAWLGNQTDLGFRTLVSIQQDLGWILPFFGALVFLSVKWEYQCPVHGVLWGFIGEYSTTVTSLSISPLACSSNLFWQKNHIQLLSPFLLPLLGCLLFKLLHTLIQPP